MSKPTYEELEKRVRELEATLGRVFDEAMSAEESELFELEILFNISVALASARDLDTLLGIVIDEVNKALLTEGAGVLLYDEHRGDLYWRLVRDKRAILDSQKAELRIPLENSIAGWVFRNKKPARVNDTSKDPRYYPDLTRKSGFEIRKVLQAPLSTRDRTIGVIMAMNKIGGDFTDQDEALLSSMAASIALAVDNVTVYQQLKKSMDDLQMLYRASMALATTMDLDQLLEFVLAELNRAMETEAAGVVLYDERRGDLYWRAVQDEKGLITKSASALRLPLDQSISGRVFQSGEPALLNDPGRHPLFYKPFETRSGFVIRNEVIVPLHTREKTIGVLVVINKKEGQFTLEDVQVCSSLAGVVALAVENAMFFEELLGSYRELEGLNRAKSKILNHLSHELRTPLAIIQGTIATLQKKLKEMGIEEFDRHLKRMAGRVESLNRLASQVESIMMTGYSWERRMITGFLDAALTLMEVQTERTPEIEHAASVIRRWLEKTFPTHRDELALLNVKEFGEKMVSVCRSKAEAEQRQVSLKSDLENTACILIPRDVLEIIMEGLIRNAIEATPDKGRVDVVGRVQDDRYILKVKDTGIGIPEEDRELIFEGFYSVQDTENYSTKRPYSFNAGGKGIDLLRIRMYSELYGFKLSFTSTRCPYLLDALSKMPGDVAHCPRGTRLEDCVKSGGSEFVVDFPLAEKGAVVQRKSKSGVEASGGDRSRKRRVDD